MEAYDTNISIKRIASQKNRLLLPFSDNQHDLHPNATINNPSFTRMKPTTSNNINDERKTRSCPNTFSFACVIVSLTFTIITSTFLGYYAGSIHTVDSSLPIRSLANANIDPVKLSTLLLDQTKPFSPATLPLQPCPPTRYVIESISGSAVFDIMDSIDFQPLLELNTQLPLIEQEEKEEKDTTKTINNPWLISLLSPSATTFSQRFHQALNDRIKLKRKIFIVHIEAELGHIDGMELELVNLLSKLIIQPKEQELVHLLVTEPSITAYTTLLKYAKLQTDVHSTMIHPIHVQLVEYPVSKKDETVLHLTYSELVVATIPIKEIDDENEKEKDEKDRIETGRKDQPNDHERDIFFVWLDGNVGNHGCFAVLTMQPSDLPFFLMYRETKCNTKESTQARNFLKINGYQIAEKGIHVVAYRR